jgi:hypothetical protein
MRTPRTTRVPARNDDDGEEDGDADEPLMQGLWGGVVHVFQSCLHIRLLMCPLVPAG